MRTLGWFKSVVLFTGASLFAVPFIFSPKIAQSLVSRHLTMGNPSNASASPTNYLLTKGQYVLSYNNNRRTPNWVSWQLNNGWLGSVPRQDDFRADTFLPAGFYRVKSNDYVNSGLDRGHMVPSADRTATRASNSATFLMTNMIPQAPDNNQGPWAELEDYSRTLVLQGKELYIIAGGYGTCGIGRNGRKCSFSAATNVRYSITVPAKMWKVIVVLDRPVRCWRMTRSNRVICG
jgi:endonuclease G